MKRREKMKMNSKRILSLVLCLLLCFSCVVFADENEYVQPDITDQYDELAETLYTYGLFKGDANGFQLDSQSTRAAAAVMIVRLLGEENVVLSNSYAHPYKDVPSWASNYVGYLYQNNIRIVEEGNVFGANDNIDLYSYLLLIFGALGYDDVNINSSDKEIFEFALTTKLLTWDERMKIEDTVFNRGAMVYIASKALNTKMAGSDETLYEHLEKKGAIQFIDSPTKDVEFGADKDAELVEEYVQSEFSDIITENAAKYMGIRYRSGGRSPSTGFDCSGYVGYVMIQSGVWNQFYGSCVGISSKCTKVSKEEAQPGDIVFFSGTYSTSKRYSHVGIYLGDNKMIHCSSSKGVMVSDFGSGYWARYYSCIARPNVLM